MKFSFIALAVSVGWLPARQSGQIQKIPRHDASAVVKLVPVRVLDQNGRPVMGLTRDDFVLHDNNVLQKITEFEVHSFAPPAGAVEKIKETLAATSFQATGRKFFVLLDAQTNDPNGTVSAKQAALDFIEKQLRPNDEAAVLYYGPMTGLNIKQYLTSDKTKIKKAIENAKEAPPPPGFVSVMTGWGIGAFEGQVVSGGGGEESQGGSISSFGGALFTEDNIVSAPGLGMFGRTPADFKENMSEFAKALKYIQGAKNVLFFSARNAEKDIGREFGASNTPIFAINTRNWIEKGVMLTSVREKYIYAEHSLKELALASGGQYFADVKDTATITGEIQTLSGNYYVLGYYITEQWDGRFHEIKVEVKQPDFRVLVQEGYYGSKSFDQYSDIEKKLHLFDLIFGDFSASSGVLEAPVEPLFCIDGVSSNGVVLAKIPIEEKTGIAAGRSEFFTIVFNQSGETVHSVRGEVDLSAQAHKTLFPYFAVRLSPGEYKCRIVARDMTTGQSVVGQSSLIIPAPNAESSLTFFSPLVLVPEKNFQFLKLYRTRGGASQAASLLAFYPLFPVGYAPLAGVLEAGVKNIRLILPMEFRGDKIPEVELDFRLTASAGEEEIPVASRIVQTRRIGQRRNVLDVEIGLPDFKPGTYELAVVATESEKQSKQTVKTAFRVR
jgi:VWFA-related protein